MAKKNKIIDFNPIFSMVGFLFAFVIILCSCSEQKNEKHIISVMADSLNAEKSIYPDLPSAVKAAREFGSSESKIIIHKGAFYLDHTLTLDSLDNGLVIEGNDGAVLYGGFPVNNWKEEGKYLTSILPNRLPTNYSFKVIEVNGRTTLRSRLPETGYFKYNNHFEFRVKYTSAGFLPKPTYDQSTILKLSPADLALFQDEANNAEITVMHEWDETLVPIKQIFLEKNQVRLSFPVAYPPGAFKSENYCVWNTLNGLKNPGTWYYNKKENKLYYLPQKGENIDNIEVVIPVIEKIIEIDHAKDIQIKNLDFRCSTTPFKVGGFSGKWFEGALSVTDSKGCILDNNSFQSTSAHGIKAIRSDSLIIKNNTFHDLGGGAIRLIGSDCKISNNLIHDIGIVYPSAIALYCNVTDPNDKEEWEMGKDNSGLEISHNDIYNTPYTGIACGGNGSVISSNRIHKIMQTLRDGSAIYITFCDSLLLKGNIVYDIDPLKPAYAYYLDEITNNSLVKENISIDVQRPIHNHFCSNNVYENNVFINNHKDLALSFHRAKNIHFNRNIITTGNRIFAQDMKSIIEVKNNIAFSPGVKDTDTSVVIRKFAPAVMVIGTKGWQNADPEIINYKDGNIKFSESSIAHDLGIHEFDNSSAGVIKEQ